MPYFSPITSEDQLPNVGEIAEKATMDFKVEVDPKDSRELAKDIAAFANHLGGTLVIGGVESRERVTHYKEGATQDSIAQLQSAFEHAMRDRCRPTPLVEFAVVQKKDALLLLVNVHPVVSTLVAVMYEEKGKNGHNACFFPIRTNTHTTTLSPDLLPMYLSPKLRKNVILLGRIGSGDEIHIVRENQPVPFIFLEVREMENTFLAKQSDSQQIQRFSLDHIDSIYHYDETTWRVRIVT